MSLTYAQLNQKAEVAHALADKASELALRCYARAEEYADAGARSAANNQRAHAKAWTESALIGWTRAELARSYRYRALLADYRP